MIMLYASPTPTCNANNKQMTKMTRAVMLLIRMRGATGITNAVRGMGDRVGDDDDDEDVVVVDDDDDDGQQGSPIQ